MYPDPYSAQYRPAKPEPERKPEPADWFRAEYNERWRGRGYSAGKHEAGYISICRYVNGRHVQDGIHCPHHGEEEGT